MFPLYQSGVLIVSDDLANDFLDLCLPLLLNLLYLSLQLPSILPLREVPLLLAVKKAL